MGATQAVVDSHLGTNEVPAKDLTVSQKTTSSFDVWVAGDGRVQPAIHGVFCSRCLQRGDAKIYINKYQARMEWRQDAGSSKETSQVDTASCSASTV